MKKKVVKKIQPTIQTDPQLLRGVVRKRISKEVSLNAIRWCNNILVEVLSNDVGPNFPETREFLVEATRLLNKAQFSLQRGK